MRYILHWTCSSGRYRIIHSVKCTCTCTKFSRMKSFLLCLTAPVVCNYHIPHGDPSPPVFLAPTPTHFVSDSDIRLIPTQGRARPAAACARPTQATTCRPPAQTRTPHRANTDTPRSRACACSPPATRQTCTRTPSPRTRPRSTTTRTLHTGAPSGKQRRPTHRHGYF